MKRIVDLTLTYRTGMRGVQLETAKSLEKDGWNAKTLHLYSHAGTHMDAPFHFNVNDQTIDQLSLERCMGPAWLIDLEGIKPRHLITVADLGEKASRINQGESVLIKTGWSRFVDQPEYRDALPRISPELATWMVKQKIRMLGVEPPSVADVNNAVELTRIHQILLAGNVVIIEGLCNLDQIDQDQFELYAIPLKIKDGDGAPARVFAVLN